MESKKMFYTMGEIVEIFDVSPALIRHWESQFSVIKPRRNKKGNRLFTPSDLENFKIIHHLVRERGMTLKGAQQAMSKGSIVDGSSVKRDSEITERLERLHRMLIEIRNMIKDGQEPISSESLEVEDSVENEGQEEFVEQNPDAALLDNIVADLEEQSNFAEMIAQEDFVPRRVRTSEADATDKELFPFYEQRLPLESADDEFDI